MNIFNAKKYEEKVRSIITVSKIYSINDIAEIANIDVDDVVKLIEKLIKKSKNNFEYRAFKNAHINYQNYEIVLDESKSNGIIDKFGQMTNSFMDKFTAKNSKEIQKQEDWKCSYCGGLNNSETYTCSNCSANRN